MALFMTSTVSGNAIGIHTTSSVIIFCAATMCSARFVSSASPRAASSSSVTSGLS